MVSFTTVKEYKLEPAQVRKDTQGRVRAVSRCAASVVLRMHYPPRIYVFYSLHEALSIQEAPLSFGVQSFYCGFIT